MAEVRHGVDRLDEDIVRLLGERFRYMDAAARIKPDRAAVRDEALVAADYFHPPDRTPATRNTIRTILTKAGWSMREIQALRGMIRTLTHPRDRARRKPEG